MQPWTGASQASIAFVMSLAGSVVWCSEIRATEGPDNSQATKHNKIASTREHSQFHVHMGQKHYQSGDLEQAIADYSSAIELRPQEALPLYFRANTHFRMREYEAAIQDYTLALIRNPDFTMAYANRGNANTALGRLDAAEADFDAAAALAALTTISEVAAKFGDYFPAGSETGMDTEAAPAIWSDRAGFDAKLAALKADADAAVAAAPADLDGLKAVFGPLTKNCGACHETYRLKKS